MSRRAFVQRQAPAVDWNAEQAAMARHRAEVAAVEEQVRRTREEFQADADPLSQIVKQLRGIDARQDGFDQRCGVLDEQVVMLIGMVGELRDRIAGLEGPGGRFRRRKAEANLAKADETNEEHGRG